MIVVMSINARSKEIDRVTDRIKAMGFGVHVSRGKERVIIGVIGRGRPLDRDRQGDWSSGRQYVDMEG